MRIVGGRLSGRRLKVSVAKTTRPTAEKVREGLSSALQSRNAIEGARLLELYAGTGAVSFEMLSRGASFALAIDNNRRAISDISANAEMLDLRSQLKALVVDLNNDRSKLLRVCTEHGPFDLVFADPPYAETADAVTLLQVLVTRAVLSPDCMIAIEHATRQPLDLPDFDVESEYRYGDTHVTLIRPHRNS